jgi:hypothetical protein
VDDDLTEVHDVTEDDYEDSDDDHLEVHLEEVVLDDLVDDDSEVEELDENDKIQSKTSKTN